MKELVRPAMKALIVWVGDHVDQEVTTAAAMEAVGGKRNAISSFFKRQAIKGRLQLMATHSAAGKGYRYRVLPKFLYAKIYKRAGGAIKPTPIAHVPRPKTPSRNGATVTIKMPGVVREFELTETRAFELLASLARGVRAKEAVS